MISAPCSAVPLRGSGPFVFFTPIASFGNDRGDTASGSVALGETTFPFHAAIEGGGSVLLSAASHHRRSHHRDDGSGRFVSSSSLPILNSSFGNDGDAGSGSAALGEAVSSKPVCSYDCFVVPSTVQNRIAIDSLCMFEIDWTRAHIDID